MDQKLLYTAPEVEPLVVQFEGVICYSRNANSGTEYFGDGVYEEL